ncbi:hypothetical protein FRC17_006987 [Serendipita sp. 399]|nr:hypothetical protein FRC17_006987 [Serendipita sp. 399]
MDYFAKFLTIQSPVKQPQDHFAEFTKSWQAIKSTLLYPDERQLNRGIHSTDVPARLRSLGEALVHESASSGSEGGTGPCMEYLLKNVKDVLGTLVKLSEPDRPAGILAETLRAISNMVVLLDERFLVHSAVHKAVIRLLRACTGDEFQERLDGRDKVMGAAADIIRAAPSDYELDLVDLLCILCSRIRTYRQLLLIFFHDKNWFPPPPPTIEEEAEEEADSNEEEPESPVESVSTITSAPPPEKPEYEFLLFNYLLRYVHRENRIGDFARAGVLFLMDVAMSAPSGDSRQLDETKDPVYTREPSDPIADAALALAEYILDGDFADVLGAGLVAVYSLLPSKLEIHKDTASDDSDGAMTLGVKLSEMLEEKDAELEKARTFGLELSSDPEFQSRLNHFLKIIEFIQDVLRRCTVYPSDPDLEPSALVGRAISSSILQAVKTIFLQNILYPSILESSPMDGSAVAVLSYIDMMLRTLPSSSLAELVIDFLMSDDDVDAPRLANPSKSRGKSKRDLKLRRRKSSAMMLLELESPINPRQSTYFASVGRFTLKDLVFSNLRSQSDAASTAVLQLLQTLIVQHPRLTVEKLFTTVGLAEPVSAVLRQESPKSDDESFVYPGAAEPREDETYQPSSIPETTFTTHERELGLYLNLISRADSKNEGEVFSTGYDNYLRDALDTVQQQQDLLAGEGFEIVKYRLNPTDTLLSLLLQSLRTFFAHGVEFNVALTGTLTAVASCPSLSLTGWMTFGSQSSQGGVFSQSNPTQEDNDSDDGDDRSIDFKIDQQLATSTILARGIDDVTSRPVLHTVLRGLILQLDRYRDMVDGFDQFLAERRQGLLFAENLTDAINLSIELDSDKSFFSAIRETLSPPPKGTSTPPQSRSFSSLVPSFLTPKKERPSAHSKVTPSTSFDSPSPKKSRDVKLAASPFGSHYEKTGRIAVQPLIVSHPSGGSSTPQTVAEREEAGLQSDEEEDVFSPNWNSQKRNTMVTTVTLSQLLDNVVILEEFMKELSAVIQTRRSLGIDSVRYL